MILDVDIKKEEFQQALSDLSLESCEIPKVLEDYLKHVARTGIPMFEWPLIFPLIQLKLETVALQLFNDSNITTDLDDKGFQDHLQPLKHRLASFHGTPFTIQRICELLADVKMNYQKVDKFFRGFSKLVMVVSTVDSEGNKLNSMDDRFTPLVSRESSISSRSGSDYATPIPYIHSPSNVLTRRKWPPVSAAVFSPPSSPTSSPRDNDDVDRNGIATHFPVGHIDSPFASRMNGQHRRTMGGLSVTTNSNLLTHMKEEDDDEETTDVLSQERDLHQPLQLDSPSSISANLIPVDSTGSEEMRPIGKLEEIVENVPAVVASNSPVHCSKSDNPVEAMPVTPTVKDEVPQLNVEMNPVEKDVSSFMETQTLKRLSEDTGDEAMPSPLKRARVEEEQAVEECEDNASLALISLEEKMAKEDSENSDG